MFLYNVEYEWLLQKHVARWSRNMSDSVAEFRVEQSSHIVGRAVQFWAIKVVGVVLHPAPSHLEKVPPLRQKHHFERGVVWCRCLDIKNM